MSMRDLHSEENFWPCVSDMFLALFVIALVLYSTMSAEKGRGDEYISELAEQEACALFALLKNEHPDVQSLKNIDVEGIRNEGPGARPKLAASLYQLLLCRETAQYFRITEDAKKQIPASPADYSYHEAIALLYMLRSENGKRPDPVDPCYHNHMREVREHVMYEIFRKKSAFSEFSDLSKEELAAEIRKLEERLSQSVAKKDYDALNERYQRLLDAHAEAGKAEELRMQLEKLEKELQAARRNIAAADIELESWKEKAKSIADTRINVMEKVESLLKSPAYSSLRDSGVEIRKKEGIVIIPSAVFSFPKATTHYYQQGRGVITEELERRLENELRREHKENLKLLALFLDEIGRAVEAGDLPVDNIAIECHTDNDVSKIRDKKFYNDGLSLQRSFDAWRLLDKYADSRLSKYRNTGGQGLFSMTGFGMRVLPPRKLGESNADYEERCRRMQLRFNCMPKGVNADDIRSSAEGKTDSELN